MNKPVPIANIQSALATALKRARTAERRRAEARYVPTNAPYIPTEAQIRTACLEIQNYWTGQEERNRGGCGDPPPAYTRPVVDERLFEALPAETVE